MRVNVDKVLERDQKLSELDDRADALQAGASQFESSAAKLKNKYWWKNMKVKFSTVWRETLGCLFTSRIRCWKNGIETIFSQKLRGSYTEVIHCLFLSTQ